MANKIASASEEFVALVAGKAFWHVLGRLRCTLELGGDGHGVLAAAHGLAAEEGAQVASCGLGVRLCPGRLAGTVGWRW